jgi:hypothetical protein
LPEQIPPKARPISIIPTRFTEATVVPMVEGEKFRYDTLKMRLVYADQINKILEDETKLKAGKKENSKIIYAKFEKSSKVYLRPYWKSRNFPQLSNDSIIPNYKKKYIPVS